MDGRLVILNDPGSAAANDYLRLDKSREKRFAFDHAFGPEVTSQELFQATTQPLVNSVLQAYNATVFAYGATGAGKTFTMVGTASAPGVMMRTVAALFERAAEVSRPSQEGSGQRGPSVRIRCSFIEVYNENLRDLLAPDRLLLDIREDPTRGVCVSGVSEAEAESAPEVMELLRRGNQNRTTEPTAANVTSSRSHAVLQIFVEQRAPGASMPDGPEEVLMGKLSLIDLAGSERATQTDNKGLRLIEGA